MPSERRPSSAETRLDSPSQARVKRAKLANTATNKEDHDDSQLLLCTPSSVAGSKDYGKGGRSKPKDLIEVDLHQLDAQSHERLSSLDSATDADSDDDTVDIGCPQKPVMDNAALLEGAQSLRSRLSAFMPDMALANDALTKNGSLKTLEDVNEDEEHIEMNLGLGVLEAKVDSEDSCGSSSADLSEGEEGAKDAPNSQISERDVIGALLGRDRRTQGHGIEEIP